jgi:hypothetical protein
MDYGSIRTMYNKYKTTKFNNTNKKHNRILRLIKVIENSNRIIPLNKKTKYLKYLNILYNEKLLNIENDEINLLIIHNRTQQFIKTNGLEIYLERLFKYTDIYGFGMLYVTMVLLIFETSIKMSSNLIDIVDVLIKLIFHCCSIKHNIEHQSNKQSIINQMFILLSKYKS